MPANGKRGPIPTEGDVAGMTRATMIMQAIPLSTEDDRLGALTPKQREVLDLLIQHKTSKEISRLLGISPHTVDQRIMLARAKLNVATRGEVAQQNRKLLEEQRNLPISSPAIIWEKSVYQPSHVEMSETDGHCPEQDDAVTFHPAIELLREAPQMTAPYDQPAAVRGYYHVLPEMFDGPNGTLMRLGAIAGITAFLVLIVLGGLSIFSQLSAMIGH